MKKFLSLVLLLALTVMFLPEAALSVRGPSWQTNLDGAEGGFLFGLRDKNGDMARNYTIVFVVKTPGGREYRVQKAVRAHHDEFVEVVFPTNFPGAPREAQPGAYVCKYLVDGKSIYTEKFTYRERQGRGIIDNRRTSFGGK
ncbi:MAG: hypothetical protein FJ128_10255 [Deltaproteobacteria bacterium]|nr:hypothetical protein [Deltaproteobacteria bacterium]